MKTRQEIKLQAKTNMGKQRVTAILLILIALAAGIVGTLFGMIPLVGKLITVAISLGVIVYQVCLYSAFILIYQNYIASIDSVVAQMQVNPLRKLGGMLWMELWMFLWSLLFLIPGIIKGLSYSMTPYILADCPNVTAKDALKLSMRITQGHKGELFVAGLSFIGWLLLSSLTLYILAIVHVGPYMATTFAGYYIELRDEAFRKGVVRPEELGMAVQ